ncbi:MAG: hypothetical protein RJA34_2671 [Pseudomonadota bacterium]|jgi:hypothetical protein
MSSSLLLKPLMSGGEKPNARTEAALQRLRNAMHAIEQDIASHHGVYPYNHGRVTQSELCRRADVKKATLQTPLHKDTTRVDVMAWLDTCAAKLAVNREATRERVTLVADQLNAEVERLTRALQTAQSQLAAAETRIEQLMAEVARLAR